MRRAERKQLSADDFRTAWTGKTFHKDSGMGGSHTVELVGKRPGCLLHFRCVDYKNWPLDWIVSPEKAAKIFFDYVSPELHHDTKAKPRNGNGLHIPQGIPTERELLDS